MVAITLQRPSKLGRTRFACVSRNTLFRSRVDDKTKTKKKKNAFFRGEKLALHSLDAANEHKTLTFECPEAIFRRPTL